MNNEMYNNKIVQENISKLKKYGYEFINPIEGNLACGYKAIGKLAKKETMDLGTSIKSPSLEKIFINLKNRLTLIR